MPNDAYARVFGKASRGNHLHPGVVVVDDCVELLDTVAAILRSAGHEVHTAEDGLAGLNTIRRVRPAVVVLDLFMPHMSGYEVIDAVRNDPALDGLFVVVATGMAQDAQDLAEMARRADCCLAKPVDSDELLRVVDDALSRCAAQAPATGLRRHLHR